MPDGGIPREISIGASLLASAGLVSAQNIGKFLISDEAAKKTLLKNEISADTAAKIAQAGIDFAVKKNIAVSISILSRPARSLTSAEPLGSAH